MAHKVFNPWEVWFAKFPYEEDNSRFSNRPVIILYANSYEVLVVKLTCHALRRADSFDIPLAQWRDAHLDRPSVARVSKTMSIRPDMMLMKIGALGSRDAFAVFDAYRAYLLSDFNKQHHKELSIC